MFFLISMITDLYGKTNLKKFKFFIQSYLSHVKTEKFSFLLIFMFVCLMLSKLYILNILLLKKTI